MARVTVDMRDAERKIRLFKLKGRQALRMKMESEIKESIGRGISPVKGFGRFQRYSDSYIAQIKMNTAFFMKGGKLIAINKLSNKDLKSYRASKSARSANRGVGETIRKINSHLSENNKRTRPVNLKVTGSLMRSLLVKVTKMGIRISFDNKLADIHNREGAGKSKTIRRMLPTRDGEQFSRSITMRLKESLKRVANNIFKR